MKKIIVPEFVLKAVSDAWNATKTGDRVTHNIAEAVCRAISENPIVPTQQQASEMWQVYVGLRGNAVDSIAGCMAEWQRRMFLAPEPEVPEEISNLMWSDWQRQLGLPQTLGSWAPLESHNSQVIEAFRRGQKSK